ncbi:MAG: ABC-F family ATP-binding cassette domain-containing protein, partial [Clostridia bacterium]|nr:ABC-F family ATP-binding cassette domain-containing protein [Clostridia bacterium]
MASIAVNGISYIIGVDTILHDVTFSLEEGDRLGVVGVNGSGKSTLLRILSGELEADDGDVFVAKSSTVGILHQNDAFNIAEGAGESVLEQMYAAFPELLSLESRISYLESALAVERDTARIASLTGELESANSRYADGGGLYFRSRCRSMLTALGFDESYHALPITGMSGGQRTRIALARLLAREPDIMLLDEPTNHLD